MWEELRVIDITSAITNVSTPVSEIVKRIHDLGWEVDSIKKAKVGYTAVASNKAFKEKAEASGKTENIAAANLLKLVQNKNEAYTYFNKNASAWDQPFVDFQEAIAHEYADADFYNKKAAGAWNELAEDCRRRVEIIQDEVDIEITDEPIPYKTFSEMAEDIMDNRHFIVSRTNASHPIWSTNQVVDFRIAHDILGHVAAGADWSWFGINRAFQAHAPLLSYTAQKALFTEVLGQGAFNSYYGSMAPQKISFLDIFDNPTDGDKPYHHPVHPSQTIIPGSVASIPMDKIAAYEELLAPDEVLLDPNDGYQTDIDPLNHNAYNWHKVQMDDGQMVDPLNSSALHDMVKEIKSDWYNQDEATQQQAVANAFRNALLKPGKHERAHAQHFDAIRHLPASTSDPSVIWKALTKARDEHNNARGYLQANQEITPFEIPLRRMVQNINPDLNHDEISYLTDDILMNMRYEEELEALEKLGPEASADDLHREATKRLLKRLNRMTDVKANQDYDFGNERMFFESKNEDHEIYPSPLAHHVKPISDVSSNIQNITKSAIEDIEKGGKGHHFRNSLMKRYTRDIDPAAIDDAWFYLAPETSQLGAITPEILKTLGRKKDDLNLRDYFRHERELQAARDASGYGHMPLGQFSKGIKNTVSYGPGYHPSESHLHPITPVHHTNIDWSNRKQKLDKKKIPGWFNDTRSARKQVAKQWDQAEGISHPKGSIPYKKASGAFSTMINPFYTNDSGQRVDGNPNESLMNLMRRSIGLQNGQDISTPEIWAMNPETGKEIGYNDTIT